MKLTAENYFSKEANKEYMSNSQFRAFRKCEASAMAVLSGAWEEEASEARLQGSLVHAWNEGRLDEFKINHPQIYKKDGSLYAKYEICSKVIEVIKADPLFMAALAGKKEVIFTAELFGLPWKVLIDSYFPDKKRLCDLKVLKALDDKFWNKELGVYESAFEADGYFRQVAVYAEIERLANGREEDDYFEPFLAVATKDKAPDKAIIGFVSEHESHIDFIRSELLAVEAHMPRIKAVKEGKEKPVRCERCEYCKTTKKLTGTIFYRDIII